MDSLFKALKVFLLCAVIAGPTGCASEEKPTTDENWTPTPVPSHDDNHGWGTSVQNTH